MTQTIPAYQQEAERIARTLEALGQAYQVGTLSYEDWSAANFRLWDEAAELGVANHVIDLLR